MVVWFNPNHATEFFRSWDYVFATVCRPSLRIASWMNLLPLMTVLKFVKKNKNIKQKLKCLD